MKSSAKANLPAHGFSGLFPEELTLPGGSTGLSDCQLLSAIADRRLFAAHFLSRLITAPVVRLST
jgi:hypothetical protein